MGTDNHVTDLTRLGLTSYQARAYLALVGTDTLSAGEVARAAALPRQRIYDVLDGLVAAGLAAARPGKVVRYEAAPPEAAVGRLVSGLRHDLELREAAARALAAELGPLFESARAGRAPGCAAVILAAGRATRFGSAKLLAGLDGRPLLQHVLDLAAEARLEPVVVVLGADAPTLRQACSWRTEVLVVNPDPDAGLSSSVRLGLAQLALSQVERVVVLLGDQPRLSATQLRAILAAPTDQARPIVVPRYAGLPGSPALLERAAWPLAATLTGDQGMSQLFDARPDLIRRVDLEGANPDVDTPADLEELHRTRR